MPASPRRHSHAAALVGLVVALVACSGPPNRKSSAPPRTSSGSSSLAAPTRVALAHGTVVDVVTGSLLADRTIVIEGDRIVSVVPGDPPKADRVVDVRGKFVIPGLWDMHVHLNDPTSAKMFVANGVTGVRVMWGNPDGGMHFSMRDAFDRRDEVGPRMVIASQVLDGPRPVWPGSIALSTTDAGRKAVREAKASGVDFIKVYSLLPRDVYFAIADESKKQGLPFAGHVPELVSVAEASDAGQKSVEHLTGMLTACSSRGDELLERQREFATKPRSPGSFLPFQRKQNLDAIASYDPVRAKALFAKLAANGTWQCPTLTVLRVLGDDPPLAKDHRLAFVTAEMREAWGPQQDPRTKDKTSDTAASRAEYKKETAIVGEMARAGVPLLAGTDEPNPYCYAGFSLHDELTRLVEAGLSPLDALRAATSGPARFLGREATMGAVAEGKIADLVVLDADPLEDIGSTRQISMVVNRGIVRDRAALDALLDEAKREVARIDSAH